MLKHISQKLWDELQLIKEEMTPFREQSLKDALSNSALEYGNPNFGIFGVIFGGSVSKYTVELKYALGLEMDPEIFSPGLADTFIDESRPNIATIEKLWADDPNFAFNCALYLSGQCDAEYFLGEIPLQPVVSEEEVRKFLSATDEDALAIIGLRKADDPLYPNSSQFLAIADLYELVTNTLTEKAVASIDMASVKKYIDNNRNV